jgi:hypothetical protein
MSSDSDDFEEYKLDEDEIAEIIEWAVGTSAMVTLMWASPDHTDEESAIQRLDGFLEAIDIMVDNMPEVLHDPAMLRANHAIEVAEETEEQVMDFMEQVENWSQTGETDDS